ncbi:MAG: hypothetical protein ACN6OP_21785 [Pseudomonadales bacterium]
MTVRFPAALPMRRAESPLSSLSQQRPASLEAFWMPFSANRQFKAAPRLHIKEGYLYRFRGTQHHLRYLLQGLLQGLRAVLCCHRRTANSHQAKCKGL